MNTVTQRIDNEDEADGGVESEFMKWQHQREQAASWLKASVSCPNHMPCTTKPPTGHYN